MERISLDEYLKPFMACSALFRIDSAHKCQEHTFSVYHVHYIFKGEEAWTLKDGSVLRISTGQIGILQPNVRHGCEMNVMYPAKTLSLSPVQQAPESMPIFTHKQAVDILNMFRKAGNCVIPAPPELEGMFLELNNMILRKDRDRIDELQISLCLAQIVVAIAKASATPPASAHHKIIDKAKEYIEQNINNNIKIHKIADHVGMKTSRFFRLFRKHIGRTPADYRLWLRCERGRNLLITSEKSIAEIACELNFSSSQHFSSCFKTHFGTTPLDYRKSSKPVRTLPRVAEDQTPCKTKGK